MHSYVNKLRVLLSKDNTKTVDFSGEADSYIFDLIDKGKCGLLSETIWHKEQLTDKVVVVDDLLNATYIDFDKDLYGLYLPKEEILKKNEIQLVFTIEQATNI